MLFYTEAIIAAFFFTWPKLLHLTFENISKKSVLWNDLRLGKNFMQKT